MVRIGALLVDFDGTACRHDVAEHLLERFGDPSWPEYDEAVDRGEMGLREAAGRQMALLRGSPDEMLAYALEHCPLDPTFPPFAAWAAEQGIPMTLVSDGFGFYIRPILEASGLGDLEVRSNAAVFDGGPPRLERPYAHPVCVGCGTCKMLAAVRAGQAHGSVAFVGEGQSDRYGALYSDVVFAKDHLVDLCRSDRVPYLPWQTFDDVRRALEELDELPGAVAPDRCPGWRDP
ncbi:MAG: HAD-IB family phosphatase [Candidatus Velamenicoccus archaeovorus]